MIYLERQSKENARAYAYRVLLYNIVTLELKPDDIISEKNIASSIGISRTPIREAMMELSSNGLVNVIPQKGSYVAKFNFNIIDEARFLRLTVELAILKIICKEISDKYILELKNNLMHQRLSIKHDDVSELIKLDNEFHKILFEAANKQWSYSIVNTHMIYFDRYRYLIQKNNSHRENIVFDHENLLESIIQHDFDSAKDIISQHLGSNPDEKDFILNLYPEYFIV